jgi:hypothetical protein
VLRNRLGGDAAHGSIYAGSGTSPGGIDMWRLPHSDRAGLLQRSIARATRIRLRSILLTSGTTIVGLAPLLVHFRATEDKDIWENLALASIGGLTSSTILVATVMPVLYYATVRFVGWPWRGAWSRGDRITRIRMKWAVALALALVSAVCAALYLGHVTYHAAELGVPASLSDDHRQLVVAAGLVFGVTIALWAAAAGAGRRWWRGLVHLLASVLIAGLALSTLNLLHLPFVKELVGLLWLRSYGPVIGATWAATTAVLCCVRLLTSKRERKRRDSLELGTPPD